MKQGFQIQIQSSLTDEELKIAKNFSNLFIQETLKNNGKYYLNNKNGGGRESFLKRGHYGFAILENKELVFRRVSKNRRIFAIVKYDCLIDENNKGIKITHCSYPTCISDLEFKFARPELFIYATIGDIKG